MYNNIYTWYPEDLYVTKHCSIPYYHPKCQVEQLSLNVLLALQTSWKRHFLVKLNWNCLFKLEFPQGSLLNWAVSFMVTSVLKRFLKRRNDLQGIRTRLLHHECYSSPTRYPLLYADSLIPLWPPYLFPLQYPLLLPGIAIVTGCSFVIADRFQTVLSCWTLLKLSF